MSSSFPTHVSFCAHTAPRARSSDFMLRRWVATSHSHRKRNALCEAATSRSLTGTVRHSAGLFHHRGGSALEVVIVPSNRPLKTPRTIADLYIPYPPWIYIANSTPCPPNRHSPFSSELVGKRGMRKCRRSLDSAVKSAIYIVCSGNGEGSLSLSISNCWNFSFIRSEQFKDMRFPRHQTLDSAYSELSFFT